MKFVDLVPPLKLCKLIPTGEFADSAFIWVNGMDNKPKVICRPWDKKSIAAPAPNLQEIMAELPANQCYRLGYEFGVALANDNIENAMKSKNPATAALKLWLKLKGIEDGE